MKLEMQVDYINEYAVHKTAVLIQVPITDLTKVPNPDLIADMVYIKHLKTDKDIPKIGDRYILSIKKA